MEFLKNIDKDLLVEFKNSKLWQSTGYMSDIQRFISQEVFYRNYIVGVGGYEAARQYKAHSQLREIIALDIERLTSSKECG